MKYPKKISLIWLLLFVLHNLHSKNSAYQKSGTVISRNNEILVPILIIFIFAIICFSVYLIYKNRKLSRDQQLLNSLMENTTDSIYFKDKSSRFIRVNKATVKKLGFIKESEVIGKTDFDIFTDEHALPAYNDEQKIVTTGEPIVGIEEKETWTDGRVTWASTTKLPLTNKNTQVVGTFGITRDITNVKKAEEDLLHAKERTELIFNLAPHAVFTLDKNKIITAWNKRAEEITGFKAEEMLGRECGSVFNSECAESCGLFNESIEKPIIHKQCSLTKKDRKKIIVLRNIDYLRDKHGKIIGGIESFEDYTRQAKISYALKKSEERFRSLYENSTIGIYRSTPDGRVIIANKALLKFLGYNSLEELTSIDIASEGYKEPGTREKFQNLLNERNEIYGFESPWKKKDGTIVYLRESAKAYRDKYGRLLYYEGTVEDVTERVEAENKLKEYSEELKILNASKDKFFSIIAHDLKSPFAAVLGYAEILVSDLEEMNDSEVKLYTSNLYKVAENTFNLLQNLLEWSRLQTGRIKYDPHRFRLYNIAKQVIDLFHEPAKEKNIILEANVDQYCLAFGDENMVSTVIRNLTSNAIKFTNKNGKISISSKEQNEFIEVAVIDNGIGMKPEDLDKLFNIDIHHTTIGTSDEKGTGLGLILCKELVEKNGGEIWAESKIGEGSKFIFTLPKAGSKESDLKEKINI